MARCLRPQSYMGLTLTPVPPLNSFDLGQVLSLGKLAYIFIYSSNQPGEEKFFPILWLRKLGLGEGE